MLNIYLLLFYNKTTVIIKYLFINSLAGDACFVQDGGL